MLEQIGFEDAQLVAETGFNSSPKTNGTLFRAKRPLSIKVAKEITAVEESLVRYQGFMDSVYAEEGALGRKTKHLIALGASWPQVVNSECNIALQLQDNWVLRMKN